MSIIAVDVDDTLYSFTDLARETAIQLAVERDDKKLRRLAYAPWSEWRSPTDVTDLEDWLEIIAVCHAPTAIRKQQPFADSALTLSELVHQGHELHYISNRKPEARAETHKWLYQHRFPVADQRLTCTEERKIPLIRDCQYIIDDRPKTLVEFVHDYMWTNTYGSNNAAKRRLGFGLHRPYNAALTDVTGIKLAPSWRLLREYLIDASLIDPAKQDSLYPTVAVH